MKLKYKIVNFSVKTWKIFRLHFAPHLQIKLTADQKNEGNPSLFQLNCERREKYFLEKKNLMDLINFIDH